MKKLFNKILAVYKNSDDIGKLRKARLLLITSYVGLSMILLIGIITIILENSPALLALLTVGFLSIVFVQIFLIKGHYELSAFLLVSISFALQTFYICVDFYDNAFDIYRYTFVITIMLVIGGIFFTQIKTLISFTIMGFCGIVIFYIVRNWIQLHNGFDLLVLVSTILCVVLYLFYGIVSIFSFIISSSLLDAANRERNKAKEQRDATVKSFNILSLYTKPSLTVTVRQGQDPTKILPAKQRLTILFCDICDFVHLTDDLTPNEITNFLNMYFSVLTSIIARNGGEVDKLIGDEIMALFHDAQSAIKASFEIRDAVETMEIHGRKVNNGIGLHEGDVIVGNIGSKIKLDYTVIGKSVNMASRLQQLTRSYHEKIIISQEIFAQLDSTTQDKFNCLHSVKIRGIELPIDLFGYK